MLEQQLVVGRTYRFTFKSEFERHGVCSTTNGKTCLHKGNGVFTLKEIATFQDILLQSVDLYSNFFKPLDFTEDEYKQYFSGKPLDEFVPEYTTSSVDTETYVTETLEGGTQTVRRRVIGKREDIVENNCSRISRQFIEELCYGSFPIYKLVDVVDNDDVLYVPEKAIKGMPEVGIKEYQDMTIAVNIGYYENPTNLDNVINSLRERLAVYGVQPLNIELFSSDTLWMNPDEYEALKSIRVPGKNVTMEDTNIFKQTYKDQFIIQDGTLLKITLNTTANDGEVTFDSIKKKKGQIIDPQQFIRQMKPNTELVFESGKYYYRKADGFSSTNKKYICLVEGVDWVSGDPINHYVKARSATAISGTKYFTASGEAYSQLTPETSYSSALQYVALGTTVYYHTVTWSQMTTSDKAVSVTQYYNKVGDEYIHQSVTTGATLNENWYKKAESYQTANESYIRANPTQAYYIKVPTTYTQVSLSTGVSTSGKYQLDEYYVLDFSCDAAQNLVAKTFTYTNRLGSLTETELSLEEIEGISLQTAAEVYISNSIVQRKYDGRWFEYSHYRKCTTSDIASSNRTYYRKSGDEYVDATAEVSVGQRLSDQYYQTETVGVVISSSNFSNFSTVKGAVLGETGDVSKEVFVVDDSEESLLKRNYFAQFTAMVRDNTRLAAENESLRNLVNKLSADNIALRKGK